MDRGDGRENTPAVAAVGYLLLREEEENDDDDIAAAASSSTPQLPHHLRPCVRQAGGKRRAVVDLTSATRAAADGDIGRLRALREGQFSQRTYLVKSMWWDEATVNAAAEALSLPCLAYCIENGCDLDPGSCGGAVIAGARKRCVAAAANDAIECLECVAASTVGWNKEVRSDLRMRALIAAIEWKPPPSSDEYYCWRDIMTYLLWGKGGGGEEDITEVLRRGDNRNAVIHRAVHTGNLDALWMLWEAGAEFPAYYRAHRPAYVGEETWADIASFWEDGYADMWADGEPAPTHSVKPAAASSAGAHGASSSSSTSSE